MSPQEALEKALKDPGTKAFRDLIEAIDPSIKVFTIEIGNTEGCSKWRRIESWRAYARRTSKKET